MIERLYGWMYAIITFLYVDSHVALRMYEFLFENISLLIVEYAFRL
jgi:hypothetical protein